MAGPRHVLTLKSKVQGLGLGLWWEEHLSVLIRLQLCWTCDLVVLMLTTFGISLKLDRVQVLCTLLQTDNHASTSSLKFFTDWMLFLPPDQQHQSTE